MNTAKIFCVYIITNKPNGTLYTGVTSDLKRRIWLHKEKKVKGFSSRYGLNELVYYEVCGSALMAIAREKQLKAGSRAGKIKLIKSFNPTWKDLYFSL